MVNIFTDALLTRAEVSRYLRIPRSTVDSWLTPGDGSDPLVHQVAAHKKGHASIPFVALVEAYVLRALRDELRIPKGRVRDAVEDVRREFQTPYALASQRIATDGVDIFIEYGSGELARAGDGQRPIKEMIDGYLRYIRWGDDSFANRLTLKQFPDSAPVVIDPRFGWGAPTLVKNRVPVSAIIDLWIAGEPMAVVADEYDLTTSEVEAICRVSAESAA